MAKLMNPNTTIWWVDVDGLEDPSAPTVEELSSAENISCAIVTGSTLNPTDSDTDDTRSICDEGNVATPTYDNYEGNLTFFRTNNPDNGSANDVAMATAFELFKHKGAEGYLVRRIGKKNNVEPSEQDLVSVFKFISDNPQDVWGGDEGPIQFTVPFLQQGEMHLNVPVGGGDGGGGGGGE